MSLFGDLDIASASDDPFGVPDNTYKCVVSDLVVKPNAKGNMGMTITFKIIEGDYDGATISDYKNVPHPSNTTQMSKFDEDKARAYIKARLADLGIPEERMNSVTKDDLIGIECYVSTVRNSTDKGVFTNVRNVSLKAEDSFSATASASANPFA